MAKRHFVFLIDGQEIVMPVTPSGYELTKAMKVATVYMTQWGDYVLPGRETAEPTELEFLLPAQEYPFISPGGVADPDYYRAIFDRCIEERLTIRLIITEANLSADVLVQRAILSEDDGTCDRKLRLTLYPRRALPDPTAEVAGAGGVSPAVQVTATESAAARTADEPPRADSYRIAEGETLYAIARRVYGTTAVVPALAAINGIAQVTLATAGMVIQLPDRAQME